MNTTIRWILECIHEFRERLYNLIEVEFTDMASWSRTYDRMMITCIIASILPLCFKESNALFVAVEHLTVNIFILDYFLRWLTADLKHPGWGFLAFFRYPFTFFAIIDLVSILPSLSIVTTSVTFNQSLKLLRLFRLGKSLKTLRLLRYSSGFQAIYAAVQKERQALLAVVWLAFGYIFLSALVMFSVEPSNFRSFFDAIYWAVVTLTTVGYGDVYPLTDFGRVVSMISSLVGMAIVALPTGIITAGFMTELENHYSNQEDEKKET